MLGEALLKRYIGGVLAGLTDLPDGHSFFQDGDHVVITRGDEIAVELFPDGSLYVDEGEADLVWRAAFAFKPGRWTL